MIAVLFAVVMMVLGIIDLLIMVLWKIIKLGLLILLMPSGGGPSSHSSQGRMSGIAPSDAKYSYTDFNGETRFSRDPDYGKINPNAHRIGSGGVIKHDGNYDMDHPNYS